MNTKWQSALLTDLIALLLGMITTLAFAPYQIFPLAVITPAVLLFLWLKSSINRAFWLGYLYGLGLFSTGIYWIFHSIHSFGDVPTLPAIFITAGLVAYLAIYPALAGFLLNRFFPYQTREKILFAFPALWVLCEWLRGIVATGFPWLFLGYSQTASPLKGYAPIFSVYGISLALTISSALFVLSYLNYQEKKFSALYLNLLTVLGIWIAGALFNLIPWTYAYEKPIAVALVQGNIPQSLKWSPDELQLSLNRYKDLTTPLLAKDKLIIWPEAAVPLPLKNAMTYINKMDALAAEKGANILIGIPIQKNFTDDYFNSLIKIGAGSKGVYSKRRLVPFGEYIPSLPLLTRIMSILNIPMSNMTSGDMQQKLLSFNNIQILPSICYEIAFPDLMYTNDKSIGLLLTVTNDAWFGESSAQAQHLQMAQMRAIEFRRPLLFVSNDGITAIISAEGNVDTAIPAHQVGVLNGLVQPMQGITPWMTNGPQFILFILLFSLMIAYFANKQMRNTQTSNNPVFASTNQKDN